MFNISTARLFLASGLVLSVSACASPPPASLVQLRGDMSTASSAPADTYSRTELSEARQKLAQAEGSAHQDDMRNADILAQEGLADLKLSHARADAQHAQAATNNLRTSINTLQNEVSKGPPAPRHTPPPPPGFSPSPPFGSAPLSPNP